MHTDGMTAYKKTEYQNLTGVPMDGYQLLLTRIVHMLLSRQLSNGRGGTLTCYFAGASESQQIHGASQRAP